MIVIVDANILISAILSPSGTASQTLSIQSNNIEFVSPSFVQEEINSKSKRLCRENSMSIHYFNKASQYYYDNILFFSNNSIDNVEVLKAWNLTKDIDTKDTLYVALALTLDGLLWTGDLKLYRALRRKDFMNVVTTKELLQNIQGV